MNVRFKITRALLDAIRADLRRPHPFAHERVGFISAGLAAARNTVLVLAQEYRPVLDDEYINDRSVGAMMSAEAIRRARQWAMNADVAILHVHLHGGRGVPNFSGVDLRENAKFVPDFVKVVPRRIHGALVLSGDAARGQVWFDRTGPQPFIAEFTELGLPIRKWSAA